MYGDSWFVHFQVVIIIVLHMVDTEPHSMNHAEVINASLSDFSAEIDYRRLQTSLLAASLSALKVVEEPHFIHGEYSCSTWLVMYMHL